MQWVSEIDYDLGMHSRESAKLAKAWMTLSDRKWNSYYGVLIKRYALRLQIVSGYPAPIWVAVKMNNNTIAGNVAL